MKQEEARYDVATGEDAPPQLVAVVVLSVEVIVIGNGRGGLKGFQRLDS